MLFLFWCLFFRLLFSSSVTNKITVIIYQVTLDRLLLVDSGGQYRDGTTDVTRTVHFGTPSAAERRAFTRVLQGHIALDRAVFPSGTNGFQLDVRGFVLNVSIHCIQCTIFSPCLFFQLLFPPRACSE